MNLYELSERKGCDWARVVTKCIRNHHYTLENTYWHNGKRHCRQCNKDRCREYRALG